MTEPSVTWLGVALRKDIFLRCVKVGLCVGTVLMLINHGDRLIAGEIDDIVLAKNYDFLFSAI